MNFVVRMEKGGFVDGDPQNGPIVLAFLDRVT